MKRQLVIKTLVGQSKNWVIVLIALIILVLNIPLIKSQTIFDNKLVSRTLSPWPSMVSQAAWALYTIMSLLLLDWMPLYNAQN